MRVNQLDPNKKTLVLLHNLGTPKSPEVPDVRKYLREFLMDPEVITAPYIIRWGIVNFSVAPFRSKKTAHAYQSIWTKEGSPLLVYTQKQTQLLAEALSDKNIIVDFSMRYGELNSKNILQKHLSEGFQQILFFPLYPQYSSSTTYSSILNFEKALKELSLDLPYKIIEHFHKDENFIRAAAKPITEAIKKIKADHLLLSFHGVPEDMIQAQDPTKSHCLKDKSCCEHFEKKNSLCYRAHCLSSGREIIKAIQAEEDFVSLSFQSRVGPKKWLSPYTEEKIVQLAKEGKKRLCIASPAFVSDCLETLEELAMRGKELFLENGGEDFILAPAANDSKEFIHFLANQVSNSFSEA